MTASVQPGRRYAFVMEQTLGHVTHYKNMRAAIDSDPQVEATWYPLHFAHGAGLETLPGLRDNWSVRASLRARRLLSADNAATRYDALFLHTQVTSLFSVGLMRRVPTVVSLDATPINYDTVGAAYGHQPGSGRMEQVKRALNRRALHAAASLVTWCDWARRSLIADYGVDPERITVIPPGVNLSLWPHPESRDHDGPVRLLFVGGDFARKGGEVLLQAYRAGLRDHCELHLVTRAEVAPEPGVRVYRDLGPNSEALKRLYAQADVFVLPTLADCFPLAIQEAMAVGLPVISCPVGGIPEIVKSGGTGILVPPGNIEALRAAIESLSSDAEKRKQMGAQAQTHANHFYDSAVNARRVCDLLNNMGRGG